ncbi:response regulator transcription factor [uncultured Massilia sp.]|uniref:response regulator transcription factor n=1 Tax=uncultured Massilia sp. TaxID=169973 RepID=UPI0025E0C5C2|nr:response regulator [uncultured Massilia sp.]
MDDAKKILVIEDQDDLRLLIRLTLKQLGRVVAAADMDGALALVASERPDLVVLDVWLGTELCGLDICRILKADANMGGVKVLLLSACGQQSDVEAGLAAGADRYVVKPFSPDLLVRTARELLDA